MEKQFLTKEQSTLIHKLGFSGLCLACYDRSGNIILNKIITNKESLHYFGGPAAPLKQQALKFFRDKFDCDTEIYRIQDFIDENGNCHKRYDYTIYNKNFKEETFDDGPWENYEDIENDVINKYLELLK